MKPFLIIPSLTPPMELIPRVFSMVAAHKRSVTVLLTFPCTCLQDHFLLHWASPLLTVPGAPQAGIRCIMLDQLIPLFLSHQLPENIQGSRE